jgi:hypothetical protein
VIRLIGVELNRFGSRRAIALLLLAAAVLTVALAAKTVWDTRPPSADDVATARAQAQMESRVPTTAAELDKCKADPTGYIGPDADATDCEKDLLPSVSSLLNRERLSLPQVLDGVATKLAVLLVGVMVVAGATFIGADWESGSITNQLLFEPRRPRLWLAKATAVVIGSGIATAVLLAGFWLALYATIEARGIATTTHTDAAIWWHVLRAVVLAMAAALGSYALTMLFRHTVGTLALLFVYAAGGEIVVNLIPVHGVARWSVGNNVFGWLQDHFSYFDPTIACNGLGDCNQMQSLAHGPAALFLGVLLVLAVLVSVVTFARRDV